MRARNPEIALAEIAQLDDDPIQPTTRMLPYIPIEICHSIAQYLDLPSALRLMRTCKSLRPAGEIRVYSTLDLTGSWSQERKVLDSLSDAEYLARAAIVDVKVEHTLSALRANPYRVNYVRSMRIEPSDGGHLCRRASQLHLILEMTRQSVRSLDVLPLCGESRWTEDQTREFGTAAFFAAWNAAENAPYDRLTRLKYVHPTEAGPLFDKWLTHMPNLTEVEFASADELFPDSTEDYASFTAVFPHIRRVTLDHVADRHEHTDGAAALAAVLHLAPNTTFLRLCGHWQASSRDNALKAFRLLKLETLVTLDDNYLYEKGNGIQVHKIGGEDFPLLEAALDVGAWTEWNELNLKNFDLPKAPSLRRLSILTNTRVPLSEYASIALGLTPILTSHIPSKLLHHLGRCPVLTSILFLHIETPVPLSYASDFVEPTYFVPSTRWIQDGHRGVVIREFETPRGMESAVFWHLKVLSRAIVRPGDNHVGSRRYIGDWTRYKGRTVPRHVLEAVYKEAGMDVKSMEGGRGLRLGDGVGAWRILDEWRKTTGDESDAEDDFVLDGTEDDDLLSDEE